MKKLILTVCALACVANMFAQGTVNLQNRLTGTVIAPVYGPLPSDPTASRSGNSSAGFPAGTTDYTGFPLLAGTQYRAELWGATGTDLGAALTLQGSTDFRTGAAAGFVNPKTLTLTGIAADAAAGVFQLRVYDVNSGADWASAQIKGSSSVFAVNNIGGQVNQAPYLEGLRSFNLTGTGGVVPEPSTAALAGLGAAALLIFRRRK